ncbi:hypothetical protein HanXRQr2_Chr01g0019641 [Helianthus annuus]|uniref:Uncharacterized protein n=1 Tax=Helianthus annuus TaxID=4232 RepID=A0A251S2U7_HELAN|nr:hypothetical protein HanXRQr2_Chr01g0019641 [Helianthus annuus]
MKSTKFFNFGLHFSEVLQHGSSNQRTLSKLFIKKAKFMKIYVKNNEVHEDIC